MAAQTFDDLLPQVDLQFGPDETQIRLSGEIDFAVGPTLEAITVLAVEAGRPVSVDLTAVTFLDSTGLGFLARLVIAGADGGWTFRVSGAQQIVQEAIKIGGLATLLGPVAA